MWLWTYWIDKDLVGIVQGVVSITAKTAQVINLGYLIRIVRV